MDPEVLGCWISIFLTICIFSYLYGDNPVYKFAEHLFVGLSIGVAVIQGWYQTLKPNLVDKLVEIPAHPGNLWYLVPLILLVLLFTKLIPSVSWLARIPVAFLVSAFAAVKMTGEAQGNLVTQLGASMPDLAATYETHGWWSLSANGAGVISDVILVLGLCSCLFYFYFSAPHSGALKPVTRLAVWILMVSFGASFGLTVMGRISLAFGRALELLGKSQPVDLAEKIHAPVATVVSVLVVAAIIIAHRFLMPPPPVVEDVDG